MHDVVRVAVRDRREHLLDDHGRVLLAEEVALRDLLEEFAARAQLRHQVVALVVLEHFVQPQDVRVVLPRESAARTSFFMISIS